MGYTDDKLVPFFHQKIETTDKLTTNIFVKSEDYKQCSLCTNLIKKVSKKCTLVTKRTCNVATDRLGQSGCMWTVFHRSSSELRISVCIKLNDVDTHK